MQENLTLPTPLSADYPTDVTPFDLPTSEDDVPLTLPQQQTLVSDQLTPIQSSFTVTEQALLEELTKEELAAELADSEANLPDPFLSATRLPTTAITLGKVIGHGAFGQVHQGQWGERPVALKMIDLAQAKKNLPEMSDAGILESLQWEIARLSTLSHPNLVQFYGIWRAKEADTSYIVMEFCEGGTLQDALEKGNVTGSNRWQWALEMVQGLAYLHQQGVLHRDLKAENVLLDRYGRAKLADLGVAQVDALVQTKAAEVVEKGLQDKKFIAPENLQDPTLSTPATDVYALGLVFWQLVTGKIPRRLKELSHSELKTWVKTGEREPIPSDCPESFRALILACWQREPAKRPSMVQLTKQLNDLATEFHPNPILIKACEQIDGLVHTKRQEGLSYVMPYATEFPLQEPVDMYWKRWELAATQEAGGNPPLLLADTFNEFIQQPGIGTLLLLGESGLGKTLSVYQWADQLLKQWWEHLNAPTSINKPSHFPLLIRPLLSHWSHQHLQDAFLNALKRYGLQDSQIPLLLIVDGYDECQLDEAPQNLADHLGVSGQHANTKLIVTCRPETVTRAELATRFAAQGQLQVRYFLSFRVDQLLTYLKEQLAWDEAAFQQYQEKLQTANQLRTVLRNPFVLSLLAQSWETVSKKPLDRLNRWQIYEGFVEHSLSTHDNLISKRVQKWLTGMHKDLLDSFDAFASDVAFTAFQKEKVNLSREQAQETRSPWILLEAAIAQDSHQRFAVQQKSLAQQKVEGKGRRALLTEQDYAAMMQRRREQFVASLPLKERAENCEFTHKSFFEYFAAKRLTLLKEEANNIIVLEGLSLLNRRSLQAEPGIISFWVEGWEDVSVRVLTEPLFEIIMISRKNQTISQAASNAATLLAQARVAFSGRDLSEVCLPGANLAGAIFDDTQFQDASLSGVNFKGAYLGGTNFTNATMNNVSFGEWPNLECSSPILCICYNSNGHMMAVGLSNSNIILYHKKFVYRPSQTHDTYEKFDELKGHTSHVISVAFSPDGTLLASGSWDGTVRLWDVTTLEVKNELKAYKDCINSVAFSPDGKLLASGNSHGTVQLWDIVTHELDVLESYTNSALIQLSMMKGIEEEMGVKDFSMLWKRIGSVAFSPDGKLLASVSKDMRQQLDWWENEATWPPVICLWDVVTRKIKGKLKGHKEPIYSVMFSPDSVYLASASEDDTVRLWNVMTLEAKSELEVHVPVYSVAFSPDGVYLASGSEDGTVRLWDVMMGELKDEQKRHKSYVNSVAFSPDGTHLTSGSSDGTVRLWNMVEYKENDQEYTSPIYSLAFSSDGVHLVAGGGNYQSGEVQLWEVGSHALKGKLKGHMKCINNVAFSPDGEQLALGSKDGTVLVRLWDVVTHELVTGALLKGKVDYKAAVYSVAFSPDGKLLASGNRDGMVFVRDVVTHELVTGALLKGKVDYKAAVYSVAFSPDGKLLASGSKDNTVRLWETEVENNVLKRELKLKCELKEHTDWVMSIAFSPDGMHLASGSLDGTVRLWDAQNFVLKGKIEGHMSCVNNVAFSPDNRQLAAGSNDGIVRLWDVMTHEVKGELKGHTGWIMSVAFSPDGVHLASGSRDCSVFLWMKISNISSLQEKWILTYRFAANNTALFVQNAFLRGAKMSKKNHMFLKQGGANDDHTPPSRLPILSPLCSLSSPQLEAVSAVISFDTSMSSLAEHPRSTCTAPPKLPPFPPQRKSNLKKTFVQVPGESVYSEDQPAFQHSQYRKTQNLKALPTPLQFKPSSATSTFFSSPQRGGKAKTTVAKTDSFSIQSPKKKENCMLQ